MFFFCSFRRSLTHSLVPHYLAPICFASFLVFFGLIWPYLVTLFSFFFFFALSWQCNPLFPWPCNPIFSSLGGFIPGLEFPPIFFSSSSSCFLFSSSSFFPFFSLSSLFFSLIFLVFLSPFRCLSFVSLPPSLNFFSLSFLFYKIK